MEFVYIGIYLILGWAFTYWFRNHFLIDARWGPGDYFGLRHALLINLVWIGMCATLLLCGLVWFCFTILPEWMRKIYGIK